MQHGINLQHVRPTFGPTWRPRLLSHLQFCFHNRIPYDQFSRSFVMFRPTIVILLGQVLPLVVAFPGQLLQQRHRHPHNVVVEEKTVTVVTTVVVPPPAQSPAADDHEDLQHFSASDWQGDIIRFVHNKLKGHPQQGSVDKSVVQPPVHAKVQQQARPEVPPFQPQSNGKPDTPHHEAPNNIPSGTQGTDCAGLSVAPNVQSADLRTISHWYINYHRCNHSDTSPIIWDDSIAAQAKSCGDQCKSRNGPTGLKGVHCGA